jgi:putative transposase
MFLRINGALHYLWRAVDQHGVALDSLVQDRRDAAAAKHFFKRLLRGVQYKPRRLVADGLPSYGVAKRVIMPDVKHRQSRCLNNRAETRIGRHDGENGRCSASSLRATRSASSQRTR